MNFSALRRPMVLCFLLALLLSDSLYSKEKSFVRDYTYKAGEADSKITARAIALGQVKQLLLEEVGSYIHSTFVVTRTEDKSFSEMSVSQVKSITASIGKTEILEEKWTGEAYYLKVNMLIDEDYLKKQLEEIAHDRTQLEAMESLQRRTDSAFAEIERLRKQLQQTASASEKQDLQKRYTDITKNFTENTLAAGKPRIEVVFVLDATGSMGSMIANAKDKIWAIATMMAQSDPAPELSIGLISFRDITDTYVTRQLPLTSSIDDLYTQLLQVSAGGGGDKPESVNQALYEAVNNLQWDPHPSTLKMIYLVGDSPPHMDYPNDISYVTSCKEARKKDIIINTIQCGPDGQTRQIWQEIAQHTNGEYLSLNQSGSSFAVATPYDAELSDKARNLDKTRLYYGANKDKYSATKTESSEKIHSTGSKEEAARRAIYNVTTDAGKKSFLGEDELLEAYQTGKVEVSEIEEGQLPAEMKGMTSEEKKQYLDNKLEERRQIEDEIKTLNDKRNKYVEEQIKSHEVEVKSSFNNQIYDVFKKQAVRKNLTAPSNAAF